MYSSGWYGGLVGGPVASHHYGCGFDTHPCCMCVFSAHFAATVRVKTQLSVVKGIDNCL